MNSDNILQQLLSQLDALSAIVSERDSEEAIVRRVLELGRKHAHLMQDTNDPDFNDLVEITAYVGWTIEAWKNTELFRLNGPALLTALCRTAYGIGIDRGRDEPQ
jgi:hypothetical protein